MKCSDPALGRDIFEVDLIGDVERRHEILAHRDACEFCRAKWDEYLNLLKRVKHEFHPTADELYEYVYRPNDLGDAQKQRIKAHLNGCDQCREVYDITADVVAGEEIQPDTESSSEGLHPVLPLGLRIRHALFRPAIAVSAVAILAVAGIWIGRSVLRPESPAVRGSTSINLVEPSDGAEVRIYQEFRWQGDASITEFVFTIKDPNGTPVVTQTIKGLSYILDASATAKLRDGATYEWSVTPEPNSGPATLENPPVRRFTFLAPKGSIDYHRFDQKKREAMLDIARNGTPEQAEKLIRETTAYLKAADSATAGDRAWASYVQGTALYTSGHPAEAALKIGDAIKIWDENGRPDNSSFPQNLYSRALINYAASSEDSGDPSAAIDSYKKALSTLSGQTDELTLATTSTCYLNLGTLYRNLGLPEKAKDAYENALKIDQQLGDQDAVGDELMDIGNLLVSEFDEPERGLPLLEQARDIRTETARKNGGRFEKNAADTFDGLAAAYTAIGRFDDALKAYDTCAEIDSLYKNRQGRLLTAVNKGELYLQNLGDLGLARSSFDSVLSELKSSPDIDPETLWRAYDGRGRTELKTGELDKAEKDFLTAVEVNSRVKAEFVDKELKRTFNASHALPAYSLALLYRTRNDPTSYVDVVEHTKASALLPDQTQNSNSPKFVKLDDVRGQLPQDAMALIYFTGAETDPILLLVLGNDTASWYDLPSLKEARPFLRKFIADVRDGTDDADSKSNAGHLSEALIPATLERFLSNANVHQLVISPDSDLFNVPFDALPVSIDEPTILNERFQVSIIPSFTWINVARRKLPPRGSELSDALIVANPSIDRSFCQPSGLLAESMPARNDWRKLDGTVEEANHLLRYVGPGSRLLSGDDATSTNFEEQQLGQFQVIHFATHAFASGTLENSSLLFGCRSSPDVINGSDILKLPLNGQLVVLSACETASGKGLAAEGNDSLAWGFLAAGAADAVATRWNVDDRTASEFITRFYHELANGFTVDEAVRRAKNSYIAEHRPMKEWAAFTSIGYGRLTVNFRSGALSGRTGPLWPLMLLILTLLLSGALEFRRKYRRR